MVWTSLNQIPAHCLKIWQYVLGAIT